MVVTDKGRQTGTKFLPNSSTEEKFAITGFTAETNLHHTTLASYSSYYLYLEGFATSDLSLKKIIKVNIEGRSKLTTVLWVPLLVL